MVQEFIEIKLNGEKSIRAMLVVSDPETTNYKPLLTDEGLGIIRNIVVNFWKDEEPKRYRDWSDLSICVYDSLSMMEDVRNMNFISITNAKYLCGYRRINESRSFCFMPI